jgi:putative acetyltransferase
MPEMTIRPFTLDDLGPLMDIWLRSVRATHTFLTEDDIQKMLPLVRQALPELEMNVLCDGSKAIGFIGMSGNKIEALFLAPEFRRRGGGRRLVEHVQAKREELVLDVNEQNPEATRFYEAMGFVVVDRSELDTQGQPFPLLHMRRSILPGRSNLKLKSHIIRAFELTHDLFEHLDQAHLQLDLPGLKSNKIASQIWCVVGARESYLQGIQHGAWQGFSCSLKSPGEKQAVLDALLTTRKHLMELDFASLSDAQLELAISLLEHEVQHHGQLIRYVYANGLSFPKSWNQRYTV